MVVTIGRSEQNQYRINNSHVSGKHCRIHYQNGVYSVEDLGSMNGTYVNGQKIPHGMKVQINYGQEIFVGKVQLDWNIIGQYLPRQDGTIGLSQEEIEAQLKHQKHKPQYHKPQDDYVPQPPVQQKGLGSEVAYALHANKSFTGKAFLSLVLYYVAFYIGGLIANIAFLFEMRRTKEIIGRNPPGYGCLLFLFITHFILPLLFVLWMMAEGRNAFYEIRSFFN